MAVKNSIIKQRSWALIIIFQVSEILSVHDGTTVYLTEYASIATGSELATFDSDISSNNVRLLVDPVNNATTIKITRTGVKA